MSAPAAVFAQAEERFPLYAYHPFRHLPLTKGRTFLDFVREVSHSSIGAPA